MLLIVKCELLVLLFLFVILELDLESSLFLKGTDQLWVYDDVSHIALFKLDAVALELGVQVVHHSVGHVRLQVEYLTEPNTVDECSHVLFHLGSKELIESTGSELVDECFDQLLINW